jgi:hypothetical protein
MVKECLFFPTSCPLVCGSASRKLPSGAPVLRFGHRPRRLKRRNARSKSSAPPWASGKSSDLSTIWNERWM